MKYVKRKLHRKLRALGVPFMESQKLARTLLRDGYASEFALQALGLDARSVTLCSCCGPELVRVVFSNGVSLDFPYGSYTTMRLT